MSTATAERATVDSLPRASVAAIRICSQNRARSAWVTAAWRGCSKNSLRSANFQSSCLRATPCVTRWARRTRELRIRVPLRRQGRQGKNDRKNSCIPTSSEWERGSNGGPQTARGRWRSVGKQTRSGRQIQAFHQTNSLRTMFVAVAARTATAVAVAAVDDCSR